MSGQSTQGTVADVSTSVSGALAGLAFAAEEPWPMVGAGLEGTVMLFNALVDYFGPHDPPPPPQDSELVKSLSIVTQRLENDVLTEFQNRYEGAMKAFVRATRDHVKHELDDLYGNIQTYRDNLEHRLCYLNDASRISLYQQYIDGFAVSNNELNELNAMLGGYQSSKLQTQVAALPVYLRAVQAIVNHVHYLATMQVLLSQRPGGALVQERPVYGWYCVDHDNVKTHLVGYLDQAISFIGPLLDKLRKGYADIHDAPNQVRAKFAAKQVKPSLVQIGQAEAALVGGIRNALHLDKVTEEELRIHDKTLENLKQIRANIIDHASTTVQKARGRSAGAITPIPLFACAQPGLMRFRFEGGNGGWNPVCGPSAQVRGLIATQNAGSSDASIYYQVGGRGLNGEFTERLRRNGQLDPVNQALVQAYDDHYGAGTWSMDELIAPADKLTSLLVPLQADGTEVSHQVAAMIYSVGPKLGTNGIVDEDQYRQIYLDAFLAVARWNQGKPERAQVRALRLTFLSCGLYSGSAGKDTIFATGARLIREAALSALQQQSQLCNVGVLINCNDAGGTPGYERASMLAGLPPHAPAHAEGFDLWLPGMAPAWPPT